MKVGGGGGGGGAGRVRRVGRHMMFELLRITNLSIVYSGFSQMNMVFDPL